MYDELAAKIAQLEALRPALGDAAVDAAIAALRVEAISAVQQRIEAETASDNIQVSAGNDALVLRNITIAEGGTLIVGGRSLDLPPAPEAVEQALATYLRTLLERYQFLNLQGMGAGGTRQARVLLRSVFINVKTDLYIGELGALYGLTPAQTYPGSVRRRVVAPILTAALQGRLSSDELRKWLSELFTSHELAILQMATSNKEVDRKSYEVDQLLARLAAPRTALELIRHERALVLLGDPGSGKTTVLRHLALGFAYARLYAEEAGAQLDPELAWGGTLPLPVLAQLRRFAENLVGPPQDASPLLDHIGQVLTGDRFEALAFHLATRLEAGEVIVLLDGLDEIADDGRRAWAARAVALFQSRFPQSRVVLTSRIYTYREPCLLPPPFRVATIQPLDNEAADEFVVRWYRAALLQGSELAGNEQESSAEDRSRQLVQALGRRPRLREIAANPLLLTMICVVHQHRYRLPQQRAELYKECLLLLLEQWEQRRAEGGAAGLAAELGIPDQTDRLALIQPIAYELQVCGREEATNREVRRWLLERFLELAAGDRQRTLGLIDRFLNFLEGRSGLLIARDIRDRYAFLHKTFQEYLAARELVAGERLTDEVVAHRHATTWREVILLVAGHLVSSGLARQARGLAWALLEVGVDPEGSDDFYRSAVLAGEIVEELGGMLGREGQALKDQVVSAMGELVQRGRLSAKERVEAAFLLGRLSDPRLPAPEQAAYWCNVGPETFWFGDDRQGELKQQQIHYSFKIARFLVTNGEYARFIAAGGYGHEQWWTPEGWKQLQPDGYLYDKDTDKPCREPGLWDDSTYNEPTQPVVGVSWYEAAAYCRWLTTQGHEQGWLPPGDLIRLPASLEWECAARGNDQHRYPWGNDEPTPEHANYRETGVTRPAPVGCFPRGMAACGAEDVAGNVWEWMCSPYAEPTAVREDFTWDTGVLCSWSGWNDKTEYLCCGSRYGSGPISRLDVQGFRVVWSRALIV